jgi:hypothetical protein
VIKPRRCEFLAMTLPEIKQALDEACAATCDADLAELLGLAAEVLAECHYHGACLRCRERRADVAGYCRPCYQSHRRATRRETRHHNG